MACRSGDVFTTVVESLDAGVGMFVGTDGSLAAGCDPDSAIFSCCAWKTSCSSSSSTACCSSADNVEDSIWSISCVALIEPSYRTYTLICLWLSRLFHEMLNAFETGLPVDLLKNLVALGQTINYTLLKLSKLNIRHLEYVSIASFRPHMCCCCWINTY